MMSMCSNFPPIKAFFPRTENIYQPQTANDSLTSLKKLLKLTRFTRCHLSQSYISSQDCGKRRDSSTRLAAFKLCIEFQEYGPGEMSHRLRWSFGNRAVFELSLFL